MWQEPEDKSGKKLAKLKLKSVTKDEETNATYKLKNNSLHEAILKNNLTKVKQILTELQRKKINDYKTLNQQSLLNTPLTLAIKLGNIEIAKYLLTHTDQMDINIRDSTGLTALDYACMLRANDLITMLFEYKDSTGLHGLIIDEDRNANAALLYKEAVNEKLFNNHLAQIRPQGAKVADLFAESSGKPLGLIEEQEPYSFLKYFAKEVCINHGWLEEKDFEKNKDILISHDAFYQNFLIALPVFCSKRNAMPVDPKLHKALETYEAYDAWLEAKEKSDKPASPTHS